MIRIVIPDTGMLSEKETIALAHFFLELSGHTLEKADTHTPTVNKHIPIDEIITPPKASVYSEAANSPMEYVGEGKAGSLAEVFNHANHVEPAAMLNVEDNDIVITEETYDNDSNGTNIELPQTQVLRDSKGVKWDARIHAKNKAKTSHGLWKLGRNIVPNILHEVKAELREEARAYKKASSDLGIPKKPAAVPPPPPIPSVPKTSAATIMPPPIPVAPVEETDPFTALIVRVQSDLNSQLYTIQQVNTIVKSFKDKNGRAMLESLGSVNMYPHLIPTIISELNKLTGAMTE